jgi:hypothetical protein
MGAARPRNSSIPLQFARAPRFVKSHSIPVPHYYRHPVSLLRAVEAHLLQSFLGCSWPYYCLGTVGQDLSLPNNNAGEKPQNSHPEVSSSGISFCARGRNRRMKLQMQIAASFRDAYAFKSRSSRNVEPGFKIQCTRLFFGCLRRFVY